jgi:hypothetical protein
MLSLTPPTDFPSLLFCTSFLLFLQRPGEVPPPPLKHLPEVTFLNLTSIFLYLNFNFQGY